MVLDAIPGLQDKPRGCDHIAIVKKLVNSVLGVVRPVEIRFSVPPFLT